MINKEVMAGLPVRRAIYAFLFSLVFVVALGGVAYAMAGSGTPADPYQITNCTDLQEMNNSLGASYILMNDINCSGSVNWNSGAGFKPIGGISVETRFSGTLDGDYHVVTGLYINRASESYVSLMGGYTHNATIKNIGLEDVNLTGLNFVGSFMSTAYGDGGESVTRLSNSYATGNIACVSGGICLSGGLAGSLSRGLINNSYSWVNINGNAYSIGGLVGQTDMGDSKIFNSYARGSANGTYNIGGLVGRGYSGTIQDSYSTGNVTGTSSPFGGFIGEYTSATLTNCYWNNHTGNPDNCSGVGSPANCYAIQNNESYFYYGSNPPMNSWDFVNVWQENPGSFPTLRAFAPAELTLACGDNISSSTTLTAHLTGCAGNGLNINASNVLLDCNGYNIKGLLGADSKGVAIPLGFANVTVKNCTIFNFTYGIFSEGTNVTIVSNTVYNNTYGVWNGQSSTVNAAYNWWGSSTGPGGAGSGSGDPVTANVDYEPFCSNSACTSYALGDKPEGFTGAGSTNFSSVTNYSSVSLVLDNGISAVVNFSSPVDLSSSSLKFSDYVSMATGYISIDSTDMPELNVPATVKFTGITSSTTPVIYRDGSVCPSSICSNINYNNNTGVLTFDVTGFSTYYVSNGLSIGVSRLNYWEKENHTVSMSWIGGGSANLTAAMPSGWEFVSGSGCTNSSLIITCNNVANNSLVSFVMSVVNASAHPEFEISSVKINATSGASSFFSPDIRIIRMQDHNIFHTLVEYGRGRGNYFFDSYDSGAAGSGHTGLGCSYVPANTLLELNFLHKVVNIKQKFKIATSTAESATFTCTYPDKNIVRLHLAGEMIDLGDLVRVDYAISEIEGSWERMGYLGIDFAATDYGVNENITINCTDITYSLPGAYGDVIVDEDAFTLEFRNKTPFAISASGKGLIGNGSQEMEITYNITNLEQYTVSDVIAEIKAPPYATFIGVRGELWGTSLEKYRLERLEFAPGETEQVTLVARFNTSGAPDNLTTLPLSGGVSIEYVTCWEVNSYNPARYLQYIDADGNGTVNMSMSVEIVNLIERILRIENIVTIINSTVYEMNSTLVEFYYYMNNTIWQNLTAVDLLDRLQNFTNSTGDIITEITYLREFNDELAFLVTDSFNAQKDARSFLASGDVGSAAKSLTDARDKLQQAASLLEKEQNTLNNRINGTGGNKWIWILPLLAVAALLTFYFFGKREIKEEDAAAEKAPKAPLKRPQKERRN